MKVAAGVPAALDALELEIRRLGITGITVRNRDGWYAVCETSYEVHLGSSGHQTMAGAVTEVFAKVERGPRGR